MGNSTSRVVGCFVPTGSGKDGVNIEFLEPLDEGLGHSFCYVRPVIVDSPAITPSNSERYTVDSSMLDSETHSGSFRQEIVEEIAGWQQRSNKGFAETTFKAISGASVSANASTAPTVLLYGDVQEPAASFESTASFASIPLQPVPRGSGPLNGFMSGPLERGFASGPLERSAGLMSGPLDKGMFMSGPLDSGDRNNFSAPLAYGRQKGLGRLMRSVGRPMKSALSRTFTRRSLSHGWMQRLFLHPMSRLVWHSKEAKFRTEAQRKWAEVGHSEPEYSNSRNLQWAHGKAGEDRVHVVLSEEQGWLFVGIYDGFSGPDAPDFLMSNLYKAIDKELEGLLWDYEDKPQKSLPLSGPVETDNVEASSAIAKEECVASQMAGDEIEKTHAGFPSKSCNDCDQSQCHEGAVPSWQNEDVSGGKLTTDTVLSNELVQAEEMVKEKDSAINTDQAQVISEICQDHGANVTEEAPTNYESNFPKQFRRSKRLYELLQMELVEDMHAKDAQFVLRTENIKGESSGRTEGTDSLRESEEASLDDSNDLKHRHTASISSLEHRQIRRSLIGSKLKKMYRKQKTVRKKLFPWSYDWHREHQQVDEQTLNPSVVVRRCRSGPVDHDAVLRAMTRALATTEEAYMNMVESTLDRNPELALMGSCVLVMLMKDQDVYVMNLGDSRVILAQDRLNDRHISSNAKDDSRNRNRSRESFVRVELDRISEESPMHNPNGQVCSVNKNREISLCKLKMKAVQLSTDHSTRIEEVSGVKK